MDIGVSVKSSIREWAGKDKRDRRIGILGIDDIRISEDRRYIRRSVKRDIWGSTYRDIIVLWLMLIWNVPIFGSYDNATWKLCALRPFIIIFIKKDIAQLGLLTKTPLIFILIIGILDQRIILSELLNEESYDIIILWYNSSHTVLKSY